MSLKDVLADEWSKDPGLRYDLLRFAEEAVPFGRGHWESWSGLWAWQVDFLRGLGDEMKTKGWGARNADGSTKKLRPIRRVISSATGTGKTALVLPLILLHALVAHPKMRAVCVSPSKDQIKDKLFAAVRVMIESSPFLGCLFSLSESGKVARTGAAALSFAVFRTAREQESLQGTHSHGGQTLTMIDEASGVPDSNFDATAGARQEEQSITILAGNPLGDEGFYHRRHSGDIASAWNPVFVSKKDLPTWDPAEEADLIAEAGGEDTEIYRATVLGLPPLSGVTSFIKRRLVEESMDRPLLDAGGRPLVPHDTPLVVGVDLAREGENLNCAVFRAGMDARTVPIEQERGRDMPPADKVSWLISLATEERPPYGVPVAVYLDGTGLDGQLRDDLGQTPHARKFVWIDFGAADPAGHALNKRAALWFRLRAWLFRGGRLRRDQKLVRTITAAKAEYTRGKPGITAKEEIAKRAGKDRLDEVDALLLSMLPPPQTHRFVQWEPAGRLVRDGGRRRSWMA